MSRWKIPRRTGSCTELYKSTKGVGHGAIVGVDCTGVFDEPFYMYDRGMACIAVVRIYVEEIDGANNIERIYNSCTIFSW